MAVTGSGCEVGVVGLGVMGRNLSYNMAEHGYSVAGHDRDAWKVEQFVESAGCGQSVQASGNIKEFTGLIRRPRAVILLVPAGDAVDGVIQDLLAHLEPGDLIIDSGNSRYADTDRRERALAEKGLLFMGMGISGGERGARYGASLMPGGPRKAYERVRPILEAVAARVDGEPCVTYLGPGSAGHYVKMVHNGIEYGIMELIAETYDVMKRGLNLNANELQCVYQGWQEGELNSYLVEITARIFARRDEKSGRPLVDMILDRAMQKGTGEWTASDALELEVPTPTIDLAVAMRNLSGRKSQREAASRALDDHPAVIFGDRQGLVDRLGRALYSGMILTYAQGMALLGEASRAHGYGLNLGEVVRVWQGGCIIRADVLRQIRAAYQAAPKLVNLLLDPYLGQEVLHRREDLRQVVCTAGEMGLPVPGFAVSLAYFDAYRSSWLPANLIQAERDFFGSHTYERVDRPGVFHTDWEHA
jgi:6-phosphogluconate dehydrogenase